MNEKNKYKEIIREILEVALMELDDDELENWQVIYNLKKRLKINFSE